MMIIAMILRQDRGVFHSHYKNPVLRHGSTVNYHCPTPINLFVCDQGRCWKVLGVTFQQRRLWSQWMTAPILLLCNIRAFILFYSSFGSTDMQFFRGNTFNPEDEQLSVSLEAKLRKSDSSIDP